MPDWYTEELFEYHAEQKNIAKLESEGGIEAVQKLELICPLFLQFN